MNANNPTRFEKEESHLDATYFQSLTAPVSDLISAIASASSGGVLAVGSGGSLTAAQMLSTLHERRYGHISRAMTPLELACNPSITTNAAVFLFTAEGKNPDIIAAFKAAVMGGSRSVDIVTHRRDTRLNRLALRSGNGRIHVISSTSISDGYLAVNSLYSTIILLLRAYGHILGSGHMDDPATEESCELDPVSPTARISGQLEKLSRNVQSLVVLYDPTLKVPAIDLESKVREVGLCDIQIADFREFAHGRHFGLVGANDNRLIIAFPTSHTATIWNTLKRNIPESVTTVTCEPRRFGWANTLLDNLCSVFRLVAWLARLKGVDPGQPSVPDFGRRIYYSPLRLDWPTSSAAWMQDGPRHRPERPRSTDDTAAQYAARIEEVQFNALLLDYDGTIVDTALRRHPPRRQIAERLVHLLDRGIPVWFVTGRGQSVYHALREVLPDRVWPNVMLGLYSGTVVQPLAVLLLERATTIASSPALHDAWIVLDRWTKRVAPAISMEIRPTQISIAPTAGQTIADLWHEVAGILHVIDFPLDRIYTTDHSIDVLPRSSPKRAFLAQMTESLGVPEDHILTIADQGRWPGNDHALLNRFGGVSVNHEPIESDVGRKLCPPRLRGPGAAAWYLARLKFDDPGLSGFRARFSRRNVS